MVPGELGFPAWLFECWGTDERDTWEEIEKDAMSPNALKFVKLPYQDELNVMALDGSKIQLKSITPNNHPFPIVDVVKIRTNESSEQFPVQPTGTDYADKAVRRFAIRYQQLKRNHFRR